MEARDKVLTNSAIMDLVVRLALVAILAVLCFRLFSPFQSLLAWALILAVTLYPLHQGIAGRLGGRQGWSATVLVLTGVLLLGVPMVMLGNSLFTYVFEVRAAFESGEFGLSEPPPKVAEWPLVGARVYDIWMEAATDMKRFLADYGETLRKLITSGAARAADIASGLVMFMVSLVLAGVMMAYGESGSQAMSRIFRRLAGPERGSQLFVLSTMTVRSVAAGVVGVALLQGLILGVGFLLAGIPAAGLLALIVVVIGIMQLPALLITLPVIAYIWGVGEGSTVANAALTVFFLVGGAADGFLKPLLLGRGVDVPMPVILIGALGGMVSAGIIGLFVGAVVLSVGYVIFMSWVDEELPPQVQAALDDRGEPVD